MTTILVAAASIAVLLNLFAGMSRASHLTRGLGLRLRFSLLRGDAGLIALGEDDDPSKLSHAQAVNLLRDISDELERLAGRSADELTDDDETYFNRLTEHFAKVDKHRRSLERAASLARVRQVAEGGFGRSERGTRGGDAGDPDGYDLDPIMNPDSIEDRRFRNPWDLSEVRSFGRARSDVNAELRSRALCAIEKMQGANDRVRAAATDIIETWDDKDATIARHVLATSSPEYLRAWCKLASGNGNLLDRVEQDAVQRAMSLTDNQGGYLVPFQLDPTVIITANGSRNQIRRVARQVVATGDVWNGVSSGSVSWRWAAEGSESGDNSTTFGQPTVNVWKADGFVPISIEALQDEANATSEVARLLAFGRDELESVAFILGTGSGQPFGIVTALAGTGSEITRGTGTTLAAADVYAVDDALPARYRMNSSWLANRGFYNLVRQIDTAGGAQMWERIGADVPPELLGRPALEAEPMDGVINAATNNRLAVYGDFDNYVIADRIGMTVEFLPHLVGANRRPTGQRGWYAYYRVGADSVNDGAFRMLNHDGT